MVACVLPREFLDLRLSDIPWRSLLYGNIQSAQTLVLLL